MHLNFKQKKFGTKQKKIFQNITFFIHKKCFIVKKVKPKKAQELKLYNFIGTFKIKLLGTHLTLCV